MRSCGKPWKELESGRDLSFVVHKNVANMSLSSKIPRHCSARLNFETSPGAGRILVVELARCTILRRPIVRTKPATGQIFVAPSETPSKYDKRSNSQRTTTAKEDGGKTRG